MFAALAIGIVAVACGPSAEGQAATQKLVEFRDECLVSCQMEDCEPFCDCTIQAYRDRFDSDLAVVNYMGEVDEVYASGDTTRSRDMVKEVFEACRQHVTFP